MFHLHPTMKRRYDEQKAGRCIVNVAHKLACVLIPKTASTTMRTVLGPCRLLLDTKSKDHVFLSKCSIVMIVREPLHRFVSGYAEVEHRLCSPKTALPILRQQSFTRERTPQERFRKFVQDTHKGIFDQHLVQQSRHLKSMRCSVNEWMLFERLGEQLPVYARCHNLHGNLPHRKKSKDPRLNALLLDVLKKSRKLLHAVVEMYREDFKLYERTRRKIT